MMSPSGASSLITSAPRSGKFGMVRLHSARRPHLLRALTLGGMPQQNKHLAAAARWRPVFRCVPRHVAWRSGLSHELVNGAVLGQAGVDVAARVGTDAVDMAALE